MTSFPLQWIPENPWGAKELLVSKEISAPWSYITASKRATALSPYIEISTVFLTKVFLLRKLECEVSGTLNLQKWFLIPRK
jgi:hypothetical protein